MPSTSEFDLPYPSLTDPPNGPAQIQALAQAVEDLLSPPWITITLQPGYVANGGFHTPAYRKIGDKVEFRGVIDATGVGSPDTGSTGVANDIIFTLPLGYRPTAETALSRDTWLPAAGLSLLQANARTNGAIIVAITRGTGTNLILYNKGYSIS